MKKLQDFKDLNDYIESLPRLAIQHSQNDGNELFEAIDKLIDMKIKELKFNRTITGKIVKDNGDGTYEISYGQPIKVMEKSDDGEYGFVDKDTHTLPAINGMQYNEKDIVYIEIVNNEFSFRYIKCKRPEGL